jgi:aminopeptidase N
MKKVLVILFFCVFNNLGTSAQKSGTLKDFYSCEWNNFKEFIKIKNARTNTDTSFDVRFYYLKADVSIDRNAKYIKGNLFCRVESRINNLLNIGLSLHHSLHVDSITGNATSFSIIGDSINIILDNSYPAGQQAAITVWYQGEPVEAGGYKGLVYATHASQEPVIASLSTPYLAHYWYPCKDGPEDKADSVYLDITVPDTAINGNNVIAVSNGLLENINHSNNKVTYSWRHRYPIVTYYVMMAISNYSHFQQSSIGPVGETFPLDYYYFRESETASLMGISEMPEVMEFFSDQYGKYPFRKEKYAMSQLGFYGAIENQTNTIINSMDPLWFSISVHELSHMWFGDMITCADWHHAWLNEGFATYSEALWEEYKYGSSTFRNEMNEIKYFGSGTLYLQNDNDTFNIFKDIIYNKGAWVLHMLRGVLGDSIFFTSMKVYANETGYMYKNASTENFKKICENISGKDLDFFFDQWVYDERYPYYFYNFIQDSATHDLVFHVIQAQDSMFRWREVFIMPIQLKITDTSGHDTLVTIWNDQKSQQFLFHMNGTIKIAGTSVVFDPDNHVLCKSFYNPYLPVNDIESISEINTFNLNPNPSSDYLIITFKLNSKKAVYEIFDSSGKLVNKGLIKASKTKIPVSNFNKGMYLLRIEDGINILCKKFLKQ